jgi:pimeloyl-ACP methyl ester carboxylesterase
VPTYSAADGATLYYDVLGEGVRTEPVIVLAGGAAQHPSYLGDLAGLSGRRRLVVPHLRGVGNSPAPSRAEAGSFWWQAADVESLRLHLGLERALIIGHSAGTRLAIAYATQFPRRLAGLLLITPPADYVVDEPSDAAALIDNRRGEPAFDAAIAAMEAGPVPDVDDDTFNVWRQTIAPTGYAKWGLVEQAHARAGQWSLAAARAFFSVEPPDDLALRIGDVTVHTLVVAGAEDCTTGLAPVTALADLFPKGRAVVIDRCGHHPWVERPAAFRRAVDPFLDACLGA